MIYQFNNNGSLVNQEFINSAKTMELKRALKSKAYRPHCQVKLNSKKALLQAELTRINRLIEEQQKASAKPKNQRSKKSPEAKLAWAKNVANMVEELGIKGAAAKLGKSVVYINRTYRVYSEVYLKNKAIALAFNNGQIGWTKLHKLAENKITPERIESFVKEMKLASN